MIEDIIEIENKCRELYKLIEDFRKKNLDDDEFKLNLPQEMRDYCGTLHVHLILLCMAADGFKDELNERFEFNPKNPYDKGK